MASEAGSEEYLGEEAPTGVPSLPVDRKGDPARWQDMDTKDFLADEEEVEPSPGTGVGGEPEVGITRTSADTAKMG